MKELTTEVMNDEMVTEEVVEACENLAITNGGSGKKLAIALGTVAAVGTAVVLLKGKVKNCMINRLRKEGYKIYEPDVEIIEKDYEEVESDVEAAE